LSKVGKDRALRIAFPTRDGKGLDDEIYEHFGHTPYFVIVDVEDGEIKSVEVLPNLASEEHGPGDVPLFLAEQGVNVIICRGMGPRAAAYFQQLGIDVVSGASGRVKDVLNEYLKGNLKSAPYSPPNQMVRAEAQGKLNCCIYGEWSHQISESP
jgi:predicted Fe-Mo cluster-binding NifX family protein